MPLQGNSLTLRLTFYSLPCSIPTCLTSSAAALPGQDQAYICPAWRDFAACSWIAISLSSIVSKPGPGVRDSRWTVGDLPTLSQVEMFVHAPLPAYRGLLARQAEVWL